MEELTKEQEKHDGARLSEDGIVRDRYGDEVLPNGQVIFETESLHLYRPNVIKALIQDRITNATTTEQIAELARRFFDVPTPTIGTLRNTHEVMLRFGWYNDIEETLVAYAKYHLIKQAK